MTLINHNAGLFDRNREPRIPALVGASVINCWWPHHKKLGCNMLEPNLALSIPVRLQIGEKCVCQSASSIPGTTSMPAPMMKLPKHNAIRLAGTVRASTKPAQRIRGSASGLRNNAQ
jgi:hypothetical protein